MRKQGKYFGETTWCEICGKPIEGYGLPYQCMHKRCKRDVYLCSKCVPDDVHDIRCRKHRVVTIDLQNKRDTSIQNTFQREGLDMITEEEGYKELVTSMIDVTKKSSKDISDS